MNAALTTARLLPSRTNPESARAPSAIPRLSSKIDLPAPVSPVSAVSPEPKLKSSCSIKTTSLIDRAVSMARYRFTAASL
jgi:hypothetical protein